MNAAMVRSPVALRFGVSFVCLIAWTTTLHARYFAFDSLATAKGTGAFTSLAMKDTNTLLAAAGGAIIEFARDGADWKESRRWSSWGTGKDKAFGGSIWICADSGRLWVSDSANHRVLLFDLSAAATAPISTFGRGRIGSLDSPQLIMGCGYRAIVLDSGNQRLVKLEVRQE